MKNLRLKRFLAGVMAISVAISTLTISPIAGAEETADEGYKKIDLSNYDRTVSSADINIDARSDGSLILEGDGASIYYKLDGYVIEDKSFIEEIRVSYKHNGIESAHNFFSAYLCEPLDGDDKTAENVRNSAKLVEKTGTETYTHTDEEGVLRDDASVMSLKQADFLDLPDGHGTDLWLQVTVCETTYLESIEIKFSDDVVDPDAGYKEVPLESYDSSVSHDTISVAPQADGSLYLTGDNKYLLYDLGKYNITNDIDSDVESIRITYKHDGKTREHNFVTMYMCDFTNKEKTSQNIRNGKSDYSRTIFSVNGANTYTHETSADTSNGLYSQLTITKDQFDLSQQHGDNLWLQITVCDHTYIKSIEIKTEKYPQEPEVTPTPEPEDPNMAVMADEVKMRGLGNNTYTPLSNLSDVYEEVGMKSNAVAVMKFDVNKFLDTNNYLSKLNLTLEKYSDSHPIGVWLYEKPSGNTRTDLNWTDDLNWADTSSDNQKKMRDNISLVLGMKNYAGNASGKGACDTGYTEPLMTANVENNIYNVEFTGDKLKKVLNYARNNNGILNLVITGPSVDYSAGNTRLYFRNSDTHKAPYITAEYSELDRIEISGPASIDLSLIEETTLFDYTAKVFDQNGETDIKPTWSFRTDAKSNKARFNTDTGQLRVTPDTAEQTVTITAECGEVKQSYEVFLGNLTPTSIEITGADSINNYIATKPAEYIYRAKVLDQKGHEMYNKNVQWEFKTDAKENAVTHENGVLTVPVNVASQTIQLTAKYDGISSTKTIEVKKTIIDLPESFEASRSMKLRGFGNTAAMAIDPETEEIGMKASAPGVFRFDLSDYIYNAGDVITGLDFTVYKSGGNSIALGLWEYADPNDIERNDDVSWINTDWTNASNKASVLNNYSLIFGINDFSVNEAPNNYSPARDSYISPITTANINDNKYTFHIDGSALDKIIEHAENNGGYIDFVITSADLDARSQSVQLYMTGAKETNPQYMPTLAVTYDLPSTPRKIEITGNDELYINSQVDEYTTRYNAAVYDQNGELYEDQDVEWSAEIDAENVEFDETSGTVTVKKSSGEGTVRITAKKDFASTTKTIEVKKIPDTLRNGNFEDVDDSYLATGWTPSVPYYKLNLDNTDFYYPWNDARANDAASIFTRVQGYSEGENETGEIRGTSGIDSTVKMQYSTSLSDDEATALMNSATQSIGINNSTEAGFLQVGYEIPYYYLMDYYLSSESQQVLSNQGVYIGLEFRNKADTAFLASVATGDRFMPFQKGKWRTYTGTFTSGAENQINGKTRVNIGIRGMKGTAYIDYFRLIPKGIDTQNAYEGSNSMLVPNSLKWKSDIFSVEQNSYYTYQAMVKPETNIVDGQITYTFMDNNNTKVGELVLRTDEGEWTQADENGWRSVKGEIAVPSGATVCEVTLSNPNEAGNVWFDGLVFTKTGEAKADSVRITGGSSEAVIPESGESSYQYTAVVYDQYNNVMSSDVQWDITKAEGVSITNNGILKVKSTASEGTVTVTVSKDGKTASKIVAIIKKGDSGEPVSTGQYGLNGSFTENNGSEPYGWTNEGKYVINYAFDNGIESWKGTRTDYGAPADGTVDWSSTENHTDSASSGSLEIYNPSFNMPGSQIPNDVQIQGGMPYTYELYFKQKNVTDDSLIRTNLRYFNSTGGTIAENPNMLRYYPNDYKKFADSNGWQKWSGTEVVPMNASTVRIEMRYRGGLNNNDGYTWFDDIKVAKLTGIDNENTYNGNPSLMLVGYNENVTVTGKEYGERWLSDKLTNISQGNSYAYSAMLQTYEAESGAYLSFVFYDAEGNEIRTDKSDKVTGTTNSWAYLSGSVVAPANAVSVAVGYNLDGKGTAWASDISFNSMTDTAVAGIKINGASSIKIPSSGSKTEIYTVNTVNKNGNSVGAADATITVSDTPSGITFKNGTLTVSSEASAGTVVLKASYNGYTDSKTVSITKTDTSSNTNTGSGSGGGGGGGGGGAGGGTTVNNTLKPSNTPNPDTNPMGHFFTNNGTLIDASGSTNANDTNKVPTLLQAPGVNYFSGGDAESIFNDIDTVPWAKGAIEALYRAGVVNGKGDKQFAPEDKVTRAEFITMLVKAFRISSDNKTNSFTDVKENDWFYDTVNIAVGEGIVSGISPDYFGSSENITRQDIAVMGTRLWNSIGKQMTGNYRVAFSDLDDISDYALESVVDMAQAGIVSGMDTGEFLPLDNATRAQAAVIIYRMAVKYDE